MKCQKCGVELIEGSEERLCYDCKKKRVETFKRVGVIGAIGLAGIGLLYGISPIDFIPDIVPFGFIDDIIVGALSGLGTIGAIGIAIFNGIKAQKIADGPQNKGE